MLLIFFLILDFQKYKTTIENLIQRPIKSLFEEYGIDPLKPIKEQKPTPLNDRKLLDNIIFDKLNLTQEERDDVYLSVCALIQKRLEKSKSK